MSFYSWSFRNGLSKLDAEFAHHLGMVGLRVARAVGITRLAQRACEPDSTLAREVMGLTFPSPFGMAAGFDKGARVIDVLGHLGFGHVEIGTVTAAAQPGNPKPRLSRLVEDQAIVNRMGFNNDGADAIAVRLAHLRQQNSMKISSRALPIIGVNIGKTKATRLEDAVDDYRYSASLLSQHADYLVVNVSSPNTPGLRELQHVDSLEPILRGVQRAAATTAVRTVPVLVKVSPDLTDAEIDRIADLSVKIGIDGIVATNTTTQRVGMKMRTTPSVVHAAGGGGLSGAPLAARSLEVLQRLKTRVGKDLTLISCGGVTTARDVAERLEAGASLVQGYTGFIYEGPLWARSLNRGLVDSNL